MFFDKTQVKSYSFLCGISQQRSWISSWSWYCRCDKNARKCEQGLKPQQSCRGLRKRKSESSTDASVTDSSWRDHFSFYGWFWATCAGWPFVVVWLQIFSLPFAFHAWYATPWKGTRLQLNRFCPKTAFSDICQFLATNSSKLSFSGLQEKGPFLSVSNAHSTDCFLRCNGPCPQRTNIREKRKKIQIRHIWKNLTTFGKPKATGNSLEWRLSIKVRIVWSRAKVWGNTFHWTPANQNLRTQLVQPITERGD